MHLPNGVVRAALLVAIAITAVQAPPQRSTIAFVSTRYDPTVDPTVDLRRAFLAAEIYLMDGDGTNARRITTNDYGDGFPSLSPDGHTIVFESNRLRTDAEPLNTSDLFVMNADGSDQRALVRGASATWSPDGRQIAFHASASGTGRLISTNPGAAAADADIFVARIDELLRGASPQNLTHNPAAVDDDPDWSPDGRKIAFTSHDTTDKTDDHASAEIYVITLGVSGPPQRLTNNTEEERAPAWSPDGTRLVFSCRKGEPVQPGGLRSFELCVMNADGTGQRRLTENAVQELTPSWSPDGKQIVFHRALGGRGRFQLFVINADGTGERQLTFPPGTNGFAHWSAVPGR